MRIKLFLSSLAVFVLLSYCLVVSVEAEASMWSQAYGVTGTDGAFSVVETSDGGYAMACITGYYYCLLKADAFGTMEWYQTYGPLDFFCLDWMPVQVGFCSLIATLDGGFAVVGTTEFGFEYGDFWLVKTDESGNMEWNRTYGGTGLDVAYSLVETSDGGYAVAGSTESFGAGGRDFWLVKTDELGNMEWSQTYGGTETDEAYSLVETSDGGYAMAGGKSGNFWLVKADASGNMEWNQTYGGDEAHSLIETSDGGFALVGLTGYVPSIPAHGGNPGQEAKGNFWLVKADAFGNMEWNQTYGGTELDYAYSLAATSDGGYTLAGYTYSFGAGNVDFWLVKTDESGNMEWSQTYGGIGHDWAYSLVATSDGGYAIAGETTSIGAANRKIWLVKTDEYGVVPEYSSWLLPSILLVATLVIVVYKKKLLKPSS